MILNAIRETRQDFEARRNREPARVHRANWFSSCAKRRSTFHCTLVSAIDTETLLSQLRWRYATKQFNPQRKIDSSTWATLEEALILSPSSFGPAMEVLRDNR
jgi:hypothetical protein